MDTWRVTPYVSGSPIILGDDVPLEVQAENKSEARRRGTNRLDGVEIIYDELRIEKLNS